MSRARTGHIVVRLLAVLVVVVALTSALSRPRTDSAPWTRLRPFSPEIAAHTALRAGDEWRRGLTPHGRGEAILATHFKVPASGRAEIDLPPIGDPDTPRAIEILSAKAFDPPELRTTVRLESGAPAPTTEIQFAPEEAGQRVQLLARWTEEGRSHEPIRSEPVTIGPSQSLFVSLAQTEDGEARFSVSFVRESGEPLPVRELSGSFGPDAWRDVEVDLSGLAGETGTFLFEHASEHAAPLWGTPSLGPAPGTTPPSPPRRPNFIFVSLDTLRADRMSAYGYARQTTPHLDRRLDGGGVRFSHAIAPASSTAPSHMSLFTSTLPCTHGVLGLFAEEALPKPLRTLPEVLSDAGYATLAVTENGYMGHSFGFTRGFDRFIEMRGEDSASAPLVDATFATAARLLRARPTGAPFLLLVHTYAVHAPYLPPRDAIQAIGAEANDSDRYDAEVLHLDAVLDRFLAEAEKTGALDETYVFLLSDHGEEFGEHGRNGHGFHLFEESVHVPLIVLGEDLAPTTHEGPWGLIDVAPTVVDLAALPAWAQARGQSFAPILAGEKKDRVGPLFGETAHQNQRMALSGPLKVVYDEESSGVRVFDLSTDPRESSPLEDDESRDAGRQLLADYAEHCEETSALLEIQADRTKALSERWQSWDRERIQKLKALGYVD